MTCYCINWKYLTIFNDKWINLPVLTAVILSSLVSWCSCVEPCRGANLTFWLDATSLLGSQPTILVGRNMLGSQPTFLVGRNISQVANIAKQSVLIYSLINIFIFHILCNQCKLISLWFVCVFSLLIYYSWMWNDWKYIIIPRQNQENLSACRI